MKRVLSTILLSALVGAAVGSGVTLLFLQNRTLTSQEHIREFYLTENAVHVSPHSLRKKMDAGETDFILVDLRSAQEYEKEHIVGAINIPAYKDPNTSAYDEIERIIGSFRNLPKDKDVVVYCYSAPCMTGRKIGKLLAEDGIYVKHLGIGWNEWRYYWNLWNHDGETPTRWQEYVVSGKDPGTPKVKTTDTLTPCTQGELGC